jgi:hypothetical protein
MARRLCAPPYLYWNRLPRPLHKGLILRRRLGRTRRPFNLRRLSQQLRRTHRRPTQRGLKTKKQKMPQSTRVAESIYTQESLFDTHAGGTGIVGRSFSGSRSGGKGRIASGKLPEAKTGNTCDKIDDARIQTHVGDAKRQ